MSTLALIGMGSNLGDRAALLDFARAELNRCEGISVGSVSRYHETRAVGGPPGQGAFLNAAAALDTTLEPVELLHRLQSIESAAGRERTLRWGERTLDLDLLLFGESILDRPELTVPHPRMSIRRFVLAPLSEVAPNVRDPITGRSIRDLLANLDRRPSFLALEGWWRRPDLRAPLERLVEELGTCCWSLRDLQVLQPMLPAPWRNRPLVSLLERLDPGMWVSLGERWMVFDFAPAELMTEAVRTEPQLASLSVLAPTFIVEIPCADSAVVPGDPTPRLKLPPGSPDGYASEILASCAATRS